MADLKQAPVPEKGLPPPSTAPSEPRCAQSSTRRRVFLGLALVALCGYHFLSSSEPHLRKEHGLDINPATRGLAAHVFRGGYHPRLTPREAEKVFLSVPSNDSVAKASIVYTSYPHRTGTPGGRDLALLVKSHWSSLLTGSALSPEKNVFEAGSNESKSALYGRRQEPYVWTDTYYTFLNQPKSSIVQLLDKEGNVLFNAKEFEDVLEGDPTSKFATSEPVFHGYSKPGDVTGPLIYAGRGRKSDFEALEAKGVNFKGAVVLVKYGSNFRGLKVKAAAEAGAVGVLIYSDLLDDGEYTEANGYLAYPEGPARHPSAVQRGSVEYLSIYPGDPSTPGRPSYGDADRLGRDEIANIPTIPSRPLSYADAAPLLRALKDKGINVDELHDAGDFDGSVPGVDEFWTGPTDEVTVRLVNDVEESISPLYNTYAVIPGHLPDAVLLGNHRDAWVLGGSDPNSGTASFYDIVKGLGEAWKKGWRPLRTIVVASWDGEEYGLLGSTEFAEDHAAWLQKHAVAYLNVDASVAGGSIFGGGASPSLIEVIREAASEIPHPVDPSKTIWDDEKSKLSNLGSGSDYTAFLQHLGIASSDFGFNGPAKAIYQYHSIYDSHTWLAKFGDPGFLKHTAISKVTGLVLLRLADALSVPLNLEDYASELARYRDDLASIASSEQSAVDLEPLSRGIHAVSRAVSKLAKEVDEAQRKLRKVIDHQHQHAEHGASHPGCAGHPRAPPRKLIKLLQRVQALNVKLYTFERGFLSEAGLAGREWFKHLVYAPGLVTGYAGITWPAVTEALTLDKNATQAQQEVQRVAKTLFSLAKELQKGL